MIFAKKLLLLADQNIDLKSFLSGEILCGLSQQLQCGRPADGTCHAFNGENRCTKELIIGQKPWHDWYDRANPEMNNYNWEMFITEPDYEGRASKFRI